VSEVCVCERECVCECEASAHHPGVSSLHPRERLREGACVFVCV